MKKNAAGFSLLLILFILGGCFSPEDLKEPAGNYLQERFGLDPGEIEIISATNNWGKSQPHHTIIRISEPYPAITKLRISRKSYETVNSEGEEAEVFLDLFKGAYAVQHKELMTFTEGLIAKYGLMHRAPYDYEYDTEGEFLYYLQFNFDEQEQKELEAGFKETKVIDTAAAVKSARHGEPRFSSGRRGVVNFNFSFNTFENESVVPKAKDLLLEYERSGLLEEGIYHISVGIVTKDPEGGLSAGIDQRATMAVFKVDANGRAEVLEEGAGLDL